MLASLLQGNGSGDLSWYSQPPDPVASPSTVALIAQAAFVALVTVTPPTEVTFVPEAPDAATSSSEIAVTSVTAPIAVPGTFGWRPQFVDLVPPATRQSGELLARPTFTPGTFGWQPRHADLVVGSAPRLDAPAVAYTPAVSRWGLDGFWRPTFPDQIQVARVPIESAPARAAFTPGTFAWQPRYPDLAVALERRVIEHVAYTPAVSRWGLDGFWRPTFPDQIQVARVPIESAPTRAVFTPGTFAWQPRCPDIVSFERRVIEHVAYTPAVRRWGLDGFWRPTFPDHVQAVRAPIESAAYPAKQTAVVVTVFPLAPTIEQLAGVRWRPSSEMAAPAAQPGTFLWQPRYPDAIDRVRALYESGSPMPSLVVIPEAWAPHYPDAIDRARALIESISPRPSLVVIPEAWTPRYPDLVDRWSRHPIDNATSPPSITLIPDPESWTPHYPDFLTSGVVFISVVEQSTIDPTHPVPPPVPPVPPAPYGTGNMSGGGGGGGGAWWSDEDLYRDPPDVLEEVDDIESAAAATSIDAPSATGDVLPVVVDILGGGGGFSATKAVTNLARKKFGKHGGAAVAVGSVVAMWHVTKRWPKARGALITGSASATLESLYQLYVSEPETPATVHRVSVEAFVDVVAKTKTPIAVRAKQVLMSGKSGKLYRVLVIQYTTTIDKEQPVAWFCQEARRFDGNGALDISGTLLERLKRRGG